MFWGDQGQIAVFVRIFTVRGPKTSIFSIIRGQAQASLKGALETQREPPQHF